MDAPRTSTMNYQTPTAQVAPTVRASVPAVQAIVSTASANEPTSGMMFDLDASPVVFTSAVDAGTVSTSAPAAAEKSEEEKKKEEAITRGEVVFF
jgi:hypothetical protein